MIYCDAGEVDEGGGEGGLSLSARERILGKSGEIGCATERAVGERGCVTERAV